MVRYIHLRLATVDTHHERFSIRSSWAESKGEANYRVITKAKALNSWAKSVKGAAKFGIPIGCFETSWTRL